MIKSQTEQMYAFVKMLKEYPSAFGEFRNDGFAYNLQELQFPGALFSGTSRDEEKVKSLSCPVNNPQIFSDNSGAASGESFSKGSTLFLALKLRPEVLQRST